MGTKMIGAALLGLAATASKRPPRIVRSESEAKQLPGWKVSDLIYENDNVISELETASKGGCRPFLDRFDRFEETLGAMRPLIAQMEVPSPIDGSDGAPWFMERSKAEYVFRQYVKIYLDAKPAADLCRTRMLHGA